MVERHRVNVQRGRKVAQAGLFDATQGIEAQGCRQDTPVRQLRL